MAFMKDILTHNIPIWEECAATPFVQEVQTGKLPLEKFKRYMIQDSIDELRARVFTSKSLRICASAVPDKLNFVKCGINEFETKIQDKKEIPYLVRKIVEAGEDIYSVNLIEPTLEDIYFTLTAGRKED